MKDMTKVFSTEIYRPYHGFLKSMVLFFSCISFFVESVSAQRMKIAGDGMAVIDGKRTFILGLYEYPQDDEVLKQVASAGFNIIAVQAKDSASTVKNLGRLSSCGIGAWITGDFDLSRNAEKAKNGLSKMVRNFGSHPALLVWEVPDEALWNISTKAWEYRAKKEVKLLGKEVGEISDSVKSKMLKNRVKEIVEFYSNGDFAKGQQTADMLWKELGKDAPGNAEDITVTTDKMYDMARGLKEGYDYMKSIDPVHPVFMNHAPRNQIHQLAAYSKAADIIGCDIYPVPEYRIEHSDLADMSLASVGAYTQRMKQAAPGKPVWMVLQGFGWGTLFGNLASPEKRKELRAPDLRETRFMAYDAIVNGAKGINYWGTYLAPKDSQIWKNVLTIAHELNDIQNVIGAEDASLPLSVRVGETFNSFDRPIRVLPKQAGADVWLVVVNENKNQDPVPFGISGLDRQTGITYVDIVSGRETKIVSGSLNSFITGQGVQVWKPLSR